MWYIRISTLAGPNSATNGASNEAHDGLGDSLVPLNASVKMLSFKVGVARRAVRNVDISSCSVFPMYKVDKKIRLSACKILAFNVS